MLSVNEPDPRIWDQSLKHIFTVGVTTVQAFTSETDVPFDPLCRSDMSTGHVYIAQALGCVAHACDCADVTR